MSDSRPEPVVDAGKIAGAVGGLVTALFGALVLVGVVQQENADAWLVVFTSVGGSIAALAALVLPIYQAYQARKRVTPLSDPVDENGVDLVPVA